MALFKSWQPPKHLHICLISKRSPYPGRGGEDTYLYPVARGLVRSGHEVSILSWQDPRGRAEISREGVYAYFLGANPNAQRKDFPWLAYNKFKELHSRKPVHIVHSLDESGILIARERKRLGIVATFDVAATQMFQLFSILGMSQETVGGLLNTGFALAYKYLTTYFPKDRPVLKTADGVFVTTPLQKIFLERYYLYPEFKTFIVPYNMDNVVTEFLPKPEGLREKLNLPVGSQTIVTFSDMTEYQELSSLLRAFARVAVKKPNAHLIIVGNGPLRRKLEYESLNLVLGSRAHFVGAISSEEQADYIALSDMYVNLSARTTGIETSMLEAMAQCKTVIGSEMNPLATVIHHGVDGFLVRPADITDLSHIINNMLTDTTTAQAVGTKAREKVLDIFDIDKMVGRMLKAFYLTLERTAPRVMRRRLALNYKELARNA